ncbi:MAG: hypothetical protein GZ093_14300 [Rhodoferax sp.]|uniref:hypothetical protein n=1 Tax=Rhodoferax sp. TaxID=50421 RepID=UPI00140060D0|nr:hypothetical protein [Rhodoferax sp.]NDP39898.1 hypothetical protein [Rhodoferax sp.]
MKDAFKVQDDPNEATPNLATPDNSHNCADLPTLPLAFTVITSIKPTRLTKIIGINADGGMRKETSAMLSRGQAQRVIVADLHELKTQLDALTSAQAVTWGVTKDDSVAVCTQADTETQEVGAIARTRENFKFRAAPGVMMLDHDGLPDGELSALQFRDRLIAAAPALAEASMLWRPSASAGCVGPDGRTLSGLTRHRLYIPVLDATLIPEAGKALEALLWATLGDGWCEVGAAGQRLPRCLVDVSVWQPERLDFAGPSVLVDGVTRAGVDGVIYGDATTQFNLRLLIDSATPSIKKQAQAGQKTARAAVAEKCETARRNWVADKAPALAQRRGIKLAQATNVLERAAVHQVLMGDYELTCADGQVVNVAQLLDNPHRWHNARFADPLDPDTDRRVAVARLLNGTRPDLFSHRHGGMRYELRRQSARVQLGRGMRVDSTDAVLHVLRDRSELFDFGTNAIAFVADGKATPVSRDWLVDHAGRVAEFYSVKTERDDDGNVTSTREIPEDAPTYIANAIIAKHGSRNFRKLTAVTTAPTLRPDGSVLDEPGHDPATGLMYVTTEAYPLAVPQSPTIDQALDALAKLWHPIRLFPFADEVAIGVTLAAMLSACLRPALPTCPATGFDAPAAGTGKTLLAKCIGALATGGDVAVLPPTNEEDECRKRLFAALRGGSKVLLWDNVREPLGNSVIDSFLTSSLFADRVLGVSENVELPNRALFLVSGNNLVLTGDTHRRILLARLDAQIETPFKREFEFDPLTEVCNNRQALVVAALTIVRAYIAAGRPKVATGRIASFELWDDLVRQPLCWLRERMMESGRDLTDLPLFVDPADSIDRAASENPETSKLAALLNAWIATFGTTPTSPAQAITKAMEIFGAQSVLFDALDEIAGQNSKLNVRILGRWLERHAGQLCTGLRLVLANKTNGLKRWTVVRTVERAATDKASPSVARVAPSCEIQDVDDSVGSGIGAGQLDDVEIF